MIKKCILQILPRVSNHANLLHGHLLIIFKINGMLMREINVEKLTLDIFKRFIFFFNTNVCDLEALQKHKIFLPKILSRIL